MYSDMSTADLEALRDKLRASLTDRLTAPTKAGAAGRSAEYQQNPDQIRAELSAVIAELKRRAGSVHRGPIYLV